MTANNQICKAHSGLEKGIKTLEGSVAELWKKWNGMQRILFAIFGAIILNLVIAIIDLAGK
jgi:hypothetical protein